MIRSLAGDLAGEAALAHLGALFLDELPEFHPQVLDALHQRSKPERR